MGLFSAEKCVICGGEANALDRTKLNNGRFLCSRCVEKTGLSQGFTLATLKSMKISQIEERIEYHKRDMRENADRVANFTATYEVGHYIKFDDNHKWFAFPYGDFGFKKKSYYVFKYDEIVNFEVIEDGTTVTKGGLGKALIGGAVFGLPGAIVGASSKKTKQVCTKLEVLVTLTNPDTPIRYIRLLENEYKKSSLTYMDASRNVQKIISKFQIIVNQLEQEKSIKSMNVATQGFSAADEIKKYKELLDIGAITQEEFNKKKKELLGL